MKLLDNLRLSIKAFNKPEMKKPELFVILLLTALGLLITSASYAQWTTSTLSQARSDLCATSVGSKVFFAGGDTGFGPSNVVDIYDNSTNTWTTATLPSWPREGLSATSVGNKVFFAGGTNARGFTSIPYNAVDIYDNSAGIWTTAMLSQARRDLCATSVESKVFFAGGWTGATFSNVVDIYDTSTNTWTTATLSQARYALSSTSVGTKVFFAGGVNSPVLVSRTFSLLIKN